MGTRNWAYTVLPGLLVACASARPSGSESSTIEHMQSTKVIRLGYRDSAVPFSYLGPDGNPAGYSVDLCTRVVDGLRTDLQMPELRAQWVKVTADTRINAVVDGAIDLECGTTTATLARQERVDFSNLIFVDGTSLLSRIDLGVRTLPQLAGKRVAVIPGTTTEHVLYDAFKKAGVNVEVVNVNYSRDGLLAIDQQRVEAYAGDRAVLVNLALTSERPDRYAIIDEWLSYEPYGLMLRRDPDFRLAVNRQLARIYRSGAILEVYRTWFGKLGRPGNLLASMYELYSLPEANTTSTPSALAPASGIAASTAPGQGAAGAVPASATTGPQAAPAAFGTVPATVVPASAVGARGATMADPRSTAVDLPGLA
ncbi:MAG: transporter substrate-binding domain-containing protein, partial [Myxococcales bacterium]